MRLKKRRQSDNNDKLLSLGDIKINKKLLSYLVDNGYETKEEIENFLNPSDKDFLDPFLFEDMRQVVEKINNAVKSGKRILIYGDYDVDGVGATAIMVKYFESISYKVDYYLPSRYEDGYGLSKESIDKVNELFNFDLLITVDCGITSSVEVEYIKSLGKDVIVTDHHDVVEGCIPDCLIINAKYSKTYPFKGICGAGAALKVVCALAGYEECKKYFTICAISTIADLMELTSENRFIVKKGLKEFYTNCPKGVLSLSKACGIEGEVSSKDVGYKLTPKINAAGRMGDATTALKLYLTEDENEIFELTSSLIKLNSERQKHCNNIFDKCDNEALKDKNVIVISGKNWESGMLGIVAARFVSKYCVPAIVLTYDEKEDAYVGSARSVEGVNIHSMLESVSSLLVTFGGHAMAAGLTIKEENLSEFTSQLERQIQQVEKIEEKFYDIELTVEDINYDFLNQLEKFEPFGQGFERPVFMLTFNECNVSVMKNYQNNINIFFDNFTCVGFKKSNYLRLLKSGLTKHVLCDVYKESFKGRNYIKTLIDEIDYSCDADLKEDVVFYNLKWGISEVESGCLIERESVKNFSQNTLFVCNTYKDYLNFNCSDGYYFDCLSNCVIAPNCLTFSNKYENIVFLSKPLSNEIVLEVKRLNNANVFVVNEKMDFDYLKTLDSNRLTFSKYYKLMLNGKSYLNKDICYEDIKEKDTNFAQFIFCYLVFIELGLIVQSEKEFILSASGTKNELTNSQIYKFVQSLNF